jgi:hypothetical protein
MEEEVLVRPPPVREKYLLSGLNSPLVLVDDDEVGVLLSLGG